MWESFLQNDCLMIALGLVPAACVVIPLLIIRKMYSKTAYLVLTLTLAASIALTTTVGAINLNSTASVSQKSKSKDAYTPTNEEYLSAFSGFMLAKAYDEAESILNDYMRTYGYDDGTSSEFDYAARMKAELAYVRGTHASTDAERLAYYETALSIWREIDKDNLPEEALAADKMIRYLNKVTTDGADAELARSYLADNGAGAEDIINSRFRSRDNAAAYESAALLVLESGMLFENENVSIMTDSVTQLLEKFGDTENSDVLNALSPWRVGKLKLNLMNGDYDAIVGDIDQHATAEEYSAMIDLYIDGKISDEKLIKSFGLKAHEGSDRVKKQLKEVKSSSGSSLSSEESAIIDTKISEIERSQSNQVYNFFEQAINDFVEDPYCEADESKLYFQLATLSSVVKEREVSKNQPAEDEAEGEGKNDNENGESSVNTSSSPLYKLMASNQNSYFAKSIDSSASSSDALFRDAMNGLANSISNVGTDMTVKQYAEQASDNRYLIPKSNTYLNTTENCEVVVNELQTYVVKTGIAVNIQSVDVAAFPQITVHALISDEFFNSGEVSSELVLRDCNKLISNYTIEKIGFEKANYVLVADNSGSMYGSISELRDALNAFIDTSAANDNYGFYTFDDSIITSLPLGTTTYKEVKEAINSMTDQGGTDILGTLTTVLNETQTDGNSNNVLILMTDGSSSTYGIEDVIALAKNKGFTIYMVSLGSRSNIEEFTYLTQSTGGNLIATDDAALLQSFYTFIRSQTENKYAITYTVADTASDTRPVEIIFDNKDISDIRYYSKNGEMLDVDSDEDSFTDGYEAGKDVIGLDTTVMYFTGHDAVINVIGEGFTDTDIMYVNLNGDRVYNLRGEYVDKNTYKIVIPGNIALGVYDASISLNNGIKTFDNIFSVTDGSTVSLKYGEYSFTAAMQYPTDYGTVLSGNVVMNGWLHFKGDVTLSGDLTNGYYITLSDNSGSYISYSDSSAAGYTAYLKENGLVQSIPALGDVRIYMSDFSGNVQTTNIYLSSDIALKDLFTLVTPTVQLLPDRFDISFSSVRSDLKYMELLVTSRANTSYYSYTDIQTFRANGSGQIGKDSISVSADQQQSQYSASNSVTLFGAEAYISSPTALYFNTDTNEASVSWLARIPTFITGDTNMTFTASWKDLTLDSTALSLNESLTKRLGNKNITVAPFTLGFDNSAAFIKSASVSEVLDMKLTGKLSVSSPEAKSYVTNLAYYIGTDPILDITEAEISFPMRKFAPEGTASISFLGCDSIENATVSLTNSSIEILLPDGLDYSVNGLEMKLDDAVRIVYDNSRIGIIDYNGKISVTAGWWGETDAVTGNASQMFFGIPNTGSSSILLQTGSITDGNANAFSFNINGYGYIGKYIGR